MVSEQQAEKIGILSTVFTPSFPINSRELFAGRQTQVTKTIEAIIELGQHVILYGERGVGKTSLANTIPFFLSALNKKAQDEVEEPTSPILFSKVTCNRNDSFGNCWKKALRQLKVKQEANKNYIGFRDEKRDNEVEIQEYTLDSFLPEKTIDVNLDNISEILSHVTTSTIFIFDEFDSLVALDTKRKFADIIKTLSDTTPQITILIVGIGDSVIDLIGEHPSLERCIKQIMLPRMSLDELSQIIEKGLEKLSMRITENVREKIVGFSQGFPHYTHLLCKYACERAIYDDCELISKMHFDFAVNEALENTQESIREAYQRAVMTTRKQDKFKDVVAACALVEEDEYGTFRLTDLQEPLREITGVDSVPQSYQYHIGKLCQSERGEILKKVGFSQKYRYRFRTPLLKAFVTLKIYQEGILRDSS